MLVTSIFSFSHNVFKKLLIQGPLKSWLCGKGLTHVNQYINSAFAHLTKTHKYILLINMTYNYLTLANHSDSNSPTIQYSGQI